MREEHERRALAGKYRQLADEANDWAAKATTESLREDYVRLAIGWVELADSVGTQPTSNVGPLAGSA